MGNFSPSQPETPEENDDEGKTAAEILEEKVKAVQLDRRSYRDKFKELERVYWDISSSLSDEMDYGLLKLDMKPVKEQLLKKIE